MDDSELILGIDQSTQGSKALLFDRGGALIDSVSLPHRQIIDDRGFVEHDLNEIAKNVVECVRLLVAKDKKRKKSIACVGLSVQRETVGAWKKSTLEPLYHAIVWQCSRGAEFVNTDKVQAYKQKIREITGLELSEYFSAAKITWLMDNVPSVKEAAAANDLCLGNMDSFLVHYLTHGRCFKTDPSNASRTQLMNLKTLSFDEQLCSLFKVPLQALPDIVSSDSLFGMTDFNGILEREIPIHAAMGDSQAALFGHGCLDKGQVKATYGTGSSIMMNSGDEVSKCLHGVVNSVGFKYKGKTTYVLEGNINYSAGIISYLKDDLKLIEHPSDTEKMAKEANPVDKCCFVPALSGLGAPYFTAAVRGTIFNMSRVTGSNEIVRAALDSIALQVNDIMDLIGKSAGISFNKLCVDGGATKNSYLMQLQSDLCRVPVEVPVNAELSGTGAAYMAAIATGLADESILKVNGSIALYKPRDNQEKCKDLTALWHKAVKAAIEFGA